MFLLSFRKDEDDFMFGKIMVVLVSVLVVFLFLGMNISQPNYPNFSEQAKLKKFASYEELKDFVKSNTGNYYSGYYAGAGMAMTTTLGSQVKATSESAAPRAGSEDYSTTNIQVAGVDEPDIVKNDGRYIYTVSGQSIVIVDAYPADGAKILSNLTINGIQDIFINKDRLVVFGNEYQTYYPTEAGVAVKTIMPPRYYGGSSTFIKIYDISDRENPKLEKNLSFDGSYFDSRMIGDYVYAIINQPAYLQDDVIPLPRIMSGGIAKEIPVADIYYFDVPDYSYQFTMIVALNTQNSNEDVKNQVILMGTTQNTFVSQGNIYLTYEKRVSNVYMTDRVINEVVIPNLPDDVVARINIVKAMNNVSAEGKSAMILTILQDYINTLSPNDRIILEQKMTQKMQDIQAELAKEMEKTIVQRISINNGKIEHKASGEFPGHVLNQFSMDEYNGYFRAATTTGQLGGWGRTQSTSMNHVYILDMDLKIVGKLEDLARGEKIYSARFIGDRAYLVTFVKIDPLFVVDLSDPTNPQVLGQLKIPGYSDYLHPYDETHLIGIGKGAVAAEEGNFAWYQGVKISLFDVTDVSKPKEIAKYEIGDRGTDSYALHDHKAFLFDKNKNLLVIPILLAEIDEEKYPGGVSPQTYGDYTFQGAYVFNIDLSGITLRGRVTHQSDGEFKKSGFYYYGDASAVQRSLYIGNVLYTISNTLIKANDLTTMEEINKVALPFEISDKYGIAVQ